MTAKKGLPLKTYLRLRRAMKGTTPATGIPRAGGRPYKWQPKKKKPKGDAKEFEAALEKARKNGGE